MLLYLLSFRRLFQLTVITCFPLVMVVAMTAGFVDVVPPWDNEFTSDTLLACAIGYLIISACFYRTRPHLFLIFFTIGRACLLAGLAAYYYLWNYAAYPPEWLN